MDFTQAKFSIGQVSRIVGVTQETLRHYDRVGLLKPSLNPSNKYRMYGFDDIEKLDFILSLKELDFSLEDIKSLLLEEDLDLHLNKLDLQEEVLTNKIKRLLNVKKKISDKKKFLTTLKSHENNYDFESIEIIKLDKTLISIPFKDVFSKSMEGSFNFNDIPFEEWIGIYGLSQDGTIIEERENYYTDFSMVESFKKNGMTNFKIDSRSGNYAKAVFFGTIFEIESYMKSLLKYFYNDKVIPDKLCSLVYFKFSMKNASNETVYLSEIFFPIN